jgi:hypothetical protein
MTVLLTICALCLAASLWLKATTRYVVAADRLLIRRGGVVWMEIPFADIAEIDDKGGAIDRFFQFRMYRLGLRRTLRITKKKGIFRCVLINPRDPAPLVEAFQRSRSASQHRAGPPAAA